VISMLSLKMLQGGTMPSLDCIATMEAVTIKQDPPIKLCVLLEKRI
jgi:hypothetical protein